MKPDPGKNPPMGLIDVTEFHLLTEEEQVAKVKELLAAVACPRAKLDGTEGL